MVSFSDITRQIDGARAATDADLIIQMLRDRLVTKLTTVLKVEADRVLSEVVDEALASLHVDIQNYRDNFNMKDLFNIEVKVKSHLERKS